MARSKEKLAALTVKNATKRGMLNDGGGLYLRVTEEKTKSWIFRFKIDGKARYMGLGSIEDVSLLKAREKATDARRLLADGIDPITARANALVAARAASVKIMTFKECAEAYIKANAAGWKNAKHSAQWSNTLDTYAYPVFGELPVSAIDTGLVLKVLEPIWETKTETASRVRGRIETVLDWAKVRGQRAGDNPAQWKGHLAKLLPERSKVQKVKHHSALLYEEIGAFVAALRKHPGASAKGLEFQILTATRSGEVMGARWAEIDLVKKVWTIPAERMKAAKEHRVPLSPRALVLLEEMKQLGGEYVFPGAKETRPLTSMAFLMLLRRMNRTDLTAHGFRSTFRDWAAEQTAYPNHVVEMALAHTIGDKVEAAYRRGDLFEKRRKLMDAWATYCNVIPVKRAGNVTALNGA